MGSWAPLTHTGVKFMPNLGVSLADRFLDLSIWHYIWIQIWHLMLSSPLLWWFKTHPRVYQFMSWWLHMSRDFPTFRWLNINSGQYQIDTRSMQVNIRLIQGQLRSISDWHKVNAGQYQIDTRSTQVNIRLIQGQLRSI